MTHARPTWGSVSAGIAAVSLTAVLCPAAPATAAPASCVEAQRYAAGSGADLFRLNRLDLRPAGRAGKPLAGVGLAQTRSAVVAESPVSAAAARILAGEVEDEGGRTDDRDTRPNPGAGRPGADRSRDGDGRPADDRAGDDRAGDDRAGDGGRRVGDGRAENGGRRVGGGAGRATDQAAGRTGRPVHDSRHPATLNAVLQQQAPPTNAEPAHRSTSARKAGPLSVGAGTLSSHARWSPAMACGAATGEVTRAGAELDHATVLSGRRAGTALVRARHGVRSIATTAMQRRGTDAHSVARAAVTAGRLDLVGGAVRVTMVRPATLDVGISANGGADIRYVPAVLDVSGQTFGTRRLESAGDEVSIALSGDRPSTEAAPAVPGDPLGSLLSDVRPDAMRGVLPAAPPMLPALPPIPGVPALGAPDSGSVQAAGRDATLRISIGDVRQAMAGHAVAARATALHVELVAGSSTGPGAGKDGGVRPNGNGVLLDLDVGVLEAAAVAPEPTRVGTAGATGDRHTDGSRTRGSTAHDGVTGDSGTGGSSTEDGGSAAIGTEGGGTAGDGRGTGLPLTGPQVDLVAAGGMALLVIGSVFLVFGLHRRGSRA